MRLFITVVCLTSSYIILFRRNNRRDKMHRYFLEKIRTRKHPDIEVLQIYSKSLVVKNGLHSFHLLHPSIVYVQLHYSLVRSLHTHTHTLPVTLQDIHTCAAVESNQNGLTETQKCTIIQAECCCSSPPQQRRPAN